MVFSRYVLVGGGEDSSLLCVLMFGPRGDRWPLWVFAADVTVIILALCDQVFTEASCDIFANERSSSTAAFFADTILISFGVYS